jgi:serine/threonine protein kinase
MAVKASDRPGMAGRLVAGRYRLVAPIGQGGMGSVWRARDEVLDREVAVKEIVIPYGIPDEDHEELVQRSLREARNAARLRHPSVITVHDVVIDDGQPCIVMELLSSRSLEDVVADEGRLPPRRVAEVGLAVLDALCAAHDSGVLHRDVKPSNILLGDDGRVVLTDFGIARYEGDSKLTMTGRIMGSSGYIAPELVHGQQAALPASDLWSLGVTLYTAVEGGGPYTDDTLLAKLTAAVTAEPEPMRHAGPLAPVIAGLMRRDPAERIEARMARRLLAEVAGRAPEDPAEPVAAEQARQRENDTVDRRPPPRAHRRLPARGRLSSHPDAPAPARPGRRSRLRGRVRLAVLAAALAVPAATFAVPLVLHDGDPTAAGRETPRPGEGSTDRSGSGAAAGSAAPLDAPTPGPAALAVPTRLYVDPKLGFSIRVPADWEHTPVAYTDVMFTKPGPGVQPDLKVSLAREPEDAAAVLERSEQAFLTTSKPEYYRRYRLGPVLVPGGRPAAEWEFSFAVDGVISRVLGRSLRIREGEGYVIVLTFPEKQWAANARLRQAVFDSFRPPDGPRPIP